VLAIGQRVFVHCVGDRNGSVVLADEAGKALRSTLADGVEVEVVAWRPRGSGGTRYRVRAAGDGTDGWVHSSNLRTMLVPPPVVAPPPGAPVATDPGPAGRRFGQRPWSPR
jgi:hypothetical protein